MSRAGGFEFLLEQCDLILQHHGAGRLSRDDSNDLGWSVMAIVLALVAAECFMAMTFGHYRRSGVRTAAAA